MHEQPNRLSTLAFKTDGGCIIWAFYDVDPDSRRAMLSYRYREAESLPDQRGRHRRGGGTRENTRVIKKGEFEAVEDIGALVDRLFGPIHGGRQSAEQ